MSVNEKRRCRAIPSHWHFECPYTVTVQARVEPDTFCVRKQELNHSATASYHYI